MKIPAIYKIESKVNPKRIYIGSAIDIKDRWRCHLKDLRKNKHHSPQLQRHFNKYGEEDLMFIIVEPCLPEFLIIREQYYIDILKPYFNASPTAGSCLGIKRLKETCDKISKAKIGVKKTKEFCEQRSEYMKGNTRNKGKHWKWTEEQKQNNLIGEKNPFFGKHHTKESIDKANKARKGQKIWNKGLDKEEQLEYRKRLKSA